MSRRNLLTQAAMKLLDRARGKGALLSDGPDFARQSGAFAGALHDPGTPRPLAAHVCDFGQASGRCRRCGKEEART